MKKVEEGNYVIPFNKNFSKEAVSFLNCMLEYHPEDRASINELAVHDFILKNVNEFTQADLNQVFNKINKNGLVINVKKNKTIKKVFDTNDNNNNIINNEDQSFMRRFNELPSEVGYSHYGNIYDVSQGTNNNINLIKIFSGNINPKNVINIPINLNKNMKNNRRFTEGYVSPGKNNHIKYEINQMENEMKEEKKLEY